MSTGDSREVTEAVVSADQYIDVHERLALVAIEATDRGADGIPVLREVVEQADDLALLLSLAIAHAEDRALRGEVPPQ